MANLMLPFFYGINAMEHISGVQGISLQFHITAECDQRCKHCYMFNSSYYKSQIENTLNGQQMIDLVDEYFALLAEYGSFGQVALTGGDPLLSQHFWSILRHINLYYSERCSVVVLGNPYHITRSTAKKMKSLGVDGYQISLDGLKKTHDYLRKSGSFDSSMRALEILYDAGIQTMVAFTLSKLNAGELIPLFEYLQSQEFISGFGFDRMIPTGNGQKIKDEIFTSGEYRQILFDVLKHEVLKKSDLIISKKEEMWKLLLYELGLIDPIDTSQKEHFVIGCACGTGTVSVLADGTVFPCRKLEMTGGKYPEQSFKDIFINNEVTKLFRQYDKFKGCSTCKANIICRGCPSMKYAVTGDFFGHEPYCWRCKSDE